MSHVDATAGTVSVGDRTVTVEEAARPALRSQAVHRLSLGRTANDVLLADVDGEPLSDYQLARAVTEPVLEAGIALLNGQVVRRTTNAAHWTRRQGTSLQHL